MIYLSTQNPAFGIAKQSAKPKLAQFKPVSFNCLHSNKPITFTSNTETTDNMKEKIQSFFYNFQVDPKSPLITQFIEFINYLNKGDSGKDKADKFLSFLDAWTNWQSIKDLVSTGGTIATFKAEDSGVRQPNANVQETLSRATDNTGKIKILFNALDSSNITLQTQQKLMEELSGLANDDIKVYESRKLSFAQPGEFITLEDIPEYFNLPRSMGPGKIVMHGTDTIDENAALSAYMFLPIPIVWTASWASPGEEGSDAISNLAKADKLAKNPLTPIDVYVVIGDEIHQAKKVMKINTHPFGADKETPYNTSKPWRAEGKKLSYFASVNDKPVGYFGKDGKVYFNTKYLKNLEGKFNFHKYDYFDKPHNPIKPAYVEHLVINENTPKKVFDDLVKRLRAKGERCGAVIEGNIYAHPQFNEISETMNSLIKEDIFVTLTEYSNKFSGDGICNTILPSKLRIQLSALLNHEEDFEFSDYSRHSDNIEKVGRRVVKKNRLLIPKSFLEKGEFIIAHPGMTGEIIDDAVERLKNRKLPEGTQPVLFINGYGDGHVPIGTISMKDRLIKGFGVQHQKLADDLINKIDNEAKEKSVSADYSIKNILKHLTVLTKNEKQSDKLLRDALMQSDEMIYSIGKAVDQGIKVLMGSKPEYAIPNLDAYEIGTVLKHIGAEGITKTTREYFRDYYKVRQFV